MITTIKYNRIFLTSLIWIAILACAIKLLYSQASYESFLWILLCGAAGLSGYSLGNKPRKTVLLNSVESNEASNIPIAPAKTVPSSQPLHNIIDELTLLHTSNDLYERYQCFIRLAEDGLQQALGACCVTLWCLDRDQNHLVECLIPRDVNTLSQTKSPQTPYRINLDSPVIQRALETEKPILSNSYDKIQNLQNTPSANLQSDACIPLYREYGQPMIVSVQQNKPFTSSCNPQAFSRAAELIKLFWEQLQAANQRQWQGEHDESDKILREPAFLDRAQKQATQAIYQDELFSLVVVTIRGFRGMFAGQSQKWRLLSSLTGQALNHCLHNAKQNFLMGKMADDVYAILLLRSDTFIAKKVMKNVLNDLTRQINQSPEAHTLDLSAIELQWTLADHQNYSHSVSEMLDQIYGGLFPPDNDKPVFEHRVVIEKVKEEVKS